MSYPDNFFKRLRCVECGQEFSSTVLHTYCQVCQAPLLAEYDLSQASRRLDREQIAIRPPGMWRWHELLPVYDPRHIVTLGEGDTPLLQLPRLGAELGLEQLFIKDESGNPTGSFKARGLAAAVSKAYELNIERLIIPTAGNAGGALAAYAARAGLQAAIYMPADTPIANQIECRLAGAEVHLVPGLISDAAALAAERANRDGWFDVSTFKEPYRTEGKKVLGYELAQAFNWRLPDVILYPTGGGTGLIGMWKAFAELEALGWLGSARRPRMVAVQAAGCAPVVQAFAAGDDRCTFWDGAYTYASGLRVPKSFADRQILETLCASQGAAIAVTDEAIRAAQARLTRVEGLFAAPEGAATLAALEVMLAQGQLLLEERIVIFNTASGLKYIT